MRTVQMAPEEKASFVARMQGVEETTPANRISHVIAIASGKGGVGKSSVASAHLRRAACQ